MKKFICFFVMLFIGCCAAMPQYITGCPDSITKTVYHSSIFCASLVSDDEPKKIVDDSRHVYKIYFTYDNECRVTSRSVLEAVDTGMVTIEHHTYEYTDNSVITTFMRIFNGRTMDGRNEVVFDEHRNPVRRYLFFHPSKTVKEGNFIRCGSDSTRWERTPRPVIFGYNDNLLTHVLCTELCTDKYYILKTFKYDKKGNLVLGNHYYFLRNHALEYQHKYAYDKKNRLVSFTYMDATSGNSEMDRYKYNPDGSLHETVRSDNAGNSQTIPCDNNDSYMYDPQGRICHVKSYSPDHNGRIILSSEYQVHYPSKAVMNTVPKGVEKGLGLLDKYKNAFIFDPKNLAISNCNFFSLIKDL